MRLGIALLATALLGQAAEGPHRLELKLERRDGSAWRTVDPGLVLESGDRVRFRLTPNFDGFLYVMIQSTSGKYETLFPRQDTGEMNGIQAGKEYIVPATQGWFRIAGPPGHDVLYWMATPVSLGSSSTYRPLPPPPKSGPTPPSMTPRCDDTLFRSRGECIDSSAGARSLSSTEAVPENLSKATGAAPRELVIIRQSYVSVVASPVELIGPVVYEFRLAHK